MTRSSHRRAGARRTAASSGRRPSRRAPSSSSNSQPVFLGVAAVAVIVAVFLLSGGRDSSTADDADSSQAPAAAKATPPAATRNPVRSAGAGLPGKPPDRPAPAIDPANLALADEHYANGQAKWNEGQHARRAGETRAYAAALQEAFDELEAQRDALRAYTNWFEEADFGGWAMPAEYVDLQRRLDKYDSLYQRVKKLKAIR